MLNLRKMVVGILGSLVAIIFMMLFVMLLVIFSVFDVTDEIYIIIDHLADRVNSRCLQIQKELKNEC